MSYCGKCDDETVDQYNDRCDGCDKRICIHCSKKGDLTIGSYDRRILDFCSKQCEFKHQSKYHNDVVVRYLFVKVEELTKRVAELEYQVGEHS